MVIFSAEVLLNSFFVLLLPFLVLYHLGLAFPQIPVLGYYSMLYKEYGIFTNVPFLTILLSIFFFDYLMTVVIGIMNKKPQFIFYGLFFFIMHYITSLILISSIIPGFFGSSDGRWVSPKRLDRRLTGAVA
jgi:membrane-associated protease RseP (regulator of RpoE activity)